MKKWFSRNRLYVIGSLIGAVAGYLYWQQVGCASGTCLITSKPVNSTLYGALLGGLLLGMFKKDDKKQPVKEDNKN